MQWIGPILAIIGVLALLFGFAKNNRYILLLAGILLFLGGASGDFLRGVRDGYSASHQSNG